MTSRGDRQNARESNLSEPASLRGVIYARYSEGANQTDQSIDGQLRECRKYADENQITIVREYLDPHISGKDAEHRPAFQQMIADGDKHQFDVVIVWKTDRFARNRYDSARYKERLRRNGISIRYAAEHIPDSAEGIILESMLEGMAEYYSAELRQKIMRGMRESAYNCKVLSKPPMGLKTGKDRHYEIDEEKAVFVRQIFEMFNRGDKLKDIADAMNRAGLRTVKGNLLGISSISKIITNEKYIGVYEYKSAGIRIEDGIPPIIDRQTFYTAQRRINAQKNGSYSKRNLGRPAKRRYLLAGLIFCGECGCSMNGETTQRKYKSGNYGSFGYYICRNHRRKNNPEKSSHMAVNKEAIESLVKDVVLDVVLNGTIRGVIQEYLVERSVSLECKTRIKALKQEKKSKEIAISNIIQAIEQGIYSNSVSNRLKSLEKDIAFLETELSRQGTLSQSIVQKVDWMLDYVHAESKLSESEWQRIIQTFVKSVTCYSNGTVDICLNFYNRPMTNSYTNKIKVHKNLSDYLRSGCEASVRKRSTSLHSFKPAPESNNQAENDDKFERILKKYNFYYSHDTLAIEVTMPKRKGRNR